MAEVIIPAAELTIDLLRKVVEGITGVDRKIAIGFKNLTPVSSHHSRNRHCQRGMLVLRYFSGCIGQARWELYES